MDWLKNALGMAGAYTIARSVMDRDEQKRLAQQQAFEEMQAAADFGQELEALVSDIDDVIVDDLNAALAAPDRGAAVIAWARRSGPKLRRYRDRWGTYWGESPELNEMVERWQDALDPYIEAIDLMNGEDPGAATRLIEAMAAYRVFQAWFLQQGIEAGWRPEA